MKILVVMPTLWGGGVERVVSLLSGEWAKSHQVTIASFDASKPDYAYGGRMVDLGTPEPRGYLRKTWWMARRTARLARLLCRERPDRVISFSEAANFCAILAVALAGRLNRLSVSVRTDVARLLPLYQRLIPLFYRFPGRVIANSWGVKRGLEAVGLPGERVSIIHNPVAFQGVREAGFAPPLRGRYVLGAGRLAREKGFDRLLRAFRRLDRPDLRLAIVGEGEERARLLRLAGELGVEDRVHMPGRAADMTPWYRHAACFVLSSHYEGFPMVLVEAMAHGCPVVSFDCDYGPRELIEEGKTGLLAPEGDVEALAAGGRARVRAFAIEKIAPLWL